MKIEEVYYHEQGGKKIISFQIGGVLVEGAFIKMEETVSGVIPVTVEGYPMPFPLPWGTEVDLQAFDPGTEKNPWVLKWTGYKPELLGQWCVVRNGKKEERGLLISYETYHTQKVVDDEMKTSVQAIFTFAGGNQLTANEIV